MRRPDDLARSVVRRIPRPRRAATGQPLEPSRQLLDLLARRGEAIAVATGERRLGMMYTNLMLDTWTRTLFGGPEGVFVVTGDIPAMWLRDSSAQMRPWLPLAANSDEVAEVLRAVSQLQWRLIRHDPYANAFNDGPIGGSWHVGDVHMLARRLDPWIWERKYELDSLALPVLFAADLEHATGSSEHLDWSVHSGFADIVTLWRREQHHESSRYRFLRVDSMIRRPSDTLGRLGRGALVATTGMTWQGFRPSDDACTFGYNIPAQLVALRALRHGADWCERLWHDPALAAEARSLAGEIAEAVQRFGTLPDGSWAYEVDGRGAMLLADDANMPSLLSLPLLADVAVDDPAYQLTRQRILSSANPWWYSGSAAEGIGSPHTAPGHVWPIALAVQGLTTTDRDERLRLALLLADTTDGSGRMHEGFDADDPSDFTRGWFSWADMMFCELVDSLA